VALLDTDGDLPAPIEADPGEELRSLVFDPLRAALGAARDLILAPDGELCLLPFEVLPDGTDYLLQEYRISYLAVGRDALRFGARAVEPARPLVLADPDFDAGSRKARTEEDRGRLSRAVEEAELSFGRLPGTRAEGEEVAELLGVAAWLGPAVLERRLKRARSPRLLHIATHGFFVGPAGGGRSGDTGQVGLLGEAAADNPLLRSGLALAGANTWLRGGRPPEDAEDGLLTAEDVTGLDLLDTELVVLSACETGLGEVRIGEGVFGLRRAFPLAGARSLVMSLWKVPDGPTRELMVDYYRRLLGGAPRGEALRQAQRALKARYPDPLCWGAFICQGDPAPLPHRAT
jgi:CHAT domain-containing protein